jgi:hypothetical protein
VFLVSIKRSPLGQPDGLARALAGARVGARALAAHRQALLVAHAAVAAQVHQALDVHRRLAAQVALDRELADLLAQLVHLGVGEVLDLGACLTPAASQMSARASGRCRRSR